MRELLAAVQNELRNLGAPLLSSSQVQLPPIPLAPIPLGRGRARLPHVPSRPLTLLTLLTSLSLPPKMLWQAGLVSAVARRMLCLLVA